MGGMSGIMRTGLLAVAGVAAVLLAGCEGVEFKGRAFEAMGLTNQPKAKPSDVPTVAPLVIPPTAELPPPGSTQSAALSEQEWPNDPDLARRSAEEEAARKQQEYYEKGDWSSDRPPDEFNKLYDSMERKPGIFGGQKVGDKYRVESSGANTN